MISSSEVFDFEAREGRRMYRAQTMSANTYVFTLTAFIAGGLLFATYVGSITYGMQPNWLWLVGYFALALPGIFMSASSDNWLVSAIGYGLVVVPTGALIGPYTSLYTPESVLQIALITVGVTLAIGFVGAIYPRSVEHWGGFLFAGLLIIIFGDLARIFMLSMGITPVALGIWDWLAAALFCGLIFYDMNRAMRMPYTLDNAVDNAVALYLDIINLFIRLLAIMGKSKSSD